MRTIARTIAPTLGLIGLGLLACSGSDKMSPLPVDDFLPVFSNFWRDVKLSQHTLVLSSTADRKATGTFSGFESHPTLGSNNAISGSFTNSTSTMTITRPPIGSVPARYAGKFLQKDTLRFMREGDTLTFARQP